MYSTFTYLCDVLINPFRSVSAKEALPTPEDRSVASQPSSFSSPSKVHRSHPTSLSSKTVVSSPAVAAHRRFMQHSASTDTTGKLSRNQSRKAAAKAKASAKLSTAVTPVTSSSTSDVTASVEHAQEDDQHREKRTRLNVPATPAILKQHNGTLPIPHDHLAHAEATAAHLRSLNPPAPLFAPLVVTPPIYYNVVTPTVQTPSPALANYLGLERPAGNTQEQELKRKRIGSLIQTLIKNPAEPRTPTQLPPQPRPVTHFFSAQPTAASKPPLTPSNESPSPALPDYVQSNSPLSSSTTPPTNIKDTNELADIIPTAKQSCSPEQSPNVLMGMTWYPELPCTANGNQEMMRLVDRDGLLHTLTRKNSPVFDAINLLLQTQGLQAEHSLNHTHINAPNDPSSPHTVNEGSSSAISSSPTAVSDVPTLEPSTDPYILDVDDSEESESVSSVSAAASAEAQNFFSSSADQALVNKQVQMDGDHGQGHAPGNLTLAPCSVPASVLTDAVGSEASNVDEVLSLERCHTTRGDKQSSVAGEVERPDQSLDGVDFAALFMLSASAAHIPAPLCFVGLFKKGSEFIEATFTLRAHRRRGNVWWLLVETLTGSDLVANFAFGPGTVMSYANDGWVDFTVLPVSSRNILKNRYFVTDQDTASQIAELLRRSIEVYFPSSAHPNATKTPDAPSDLLTAQSYVQADVGGALADGLLSLLTSQMVHQTYPETAVPEALVGNGKADEGLPTAVERSSTLAETTGVARSWIAPAVSSKTVEHNENSGLDKSAEDTAPEDLATTNQDLDKATTTIDTDVVIVDVDVNAIDITAAHLEPASFAADVTAPVDTVMDDHEAATNPSSSMATTSFNATAESPILGQGFRSAAFTTMLPPNYLADDEEDDDYEEQLRAPRHWEGEDDNPTTATWRIGAPRIAQPIDIAESFISDAVISHDINKVARNLASGVISRRRRAAEMNDDF
ncbi:hypothetical protein FRB98_006731 [Tulasnella sp. 332]|nr:hypothetical protein FRB98_006731 [Tulasnella sp. 332]